MLRAIQALGTRMDRMEARMDTLVTRVETLSTRVDGLTTQVERLAARVDVLTNRVDALDRRVSSLEARMDKQERWMERLGGEFLRARDDMGERIQRLHDDMHPWRAETQSGLRRLDARVDVTSGAVFMLAMELRGPLKVEFSAELGRHLEDLRPH